MAFSAAQERFVEKRQSPRQRVHAAALVDTGDGSLGLHCTLWDISDAGVRITIDRPAEVPAEFSLVMLGEGAARRRCKVIWRSDQQIGARYVTAPDWNWTA